MSETVFLRLVSQNDKASALAEATNTIREGLSSSLTHMVNPVSFRQIPGSPFSYWVSEPMRRIFTKFPSFEGEGRMVRQGGVTGDDARYLRSYWEVNPAHLNQGNVAWVPFAKGGRYSPYWRDLSVVVHWDFTRGTFYGYTGLLHRPSEKPSSADLYFLRGLTWPLRAARFAPIPLPERSIFSIRGYAIIAPPNELPWLLALGNSTAFDAIFKLALGRYGFPEFVVGVLQKLPLPLASDETKRTFGEFGIQAVVVRRENDRWNETTHSFSYPVILESLEENQALTKAVEIHEAKTQAQQQQLAEIQREIDERAYALYGLSVEDRAQIEKGEASALTEDASAGSGAEDEEIAPADSGQLLRATCADLLMYAVGCAFGRWDVRIGRNRNLAPPLADPFAPLPVCAPGALVGPDGLPARSGYIVSEVWLRARPDAISLPPEGSVANPAIPDEDYPLFIAWDGILADDPDHEADILRRVRAGLDLLWGERAEAIEAEACSILGVRDLRDYFRNPRNFFDYHIGRYSQSRRKAPIYWLLQSPGKRYGLWLYYHRLDKDTLFKALTKYVEPKIHLEDSRLEQWRAQLAAAGSEGREVKQLERQLERQESLVAELYDFRDKLRRAADLNLEPDLNDGVVLNIAPLRELVLWNEAKKYWDELLAGKYEWSSISKQLRSKGVI